MHQMPDLSSPSNPSKQPTLFDQDAHAVMPEQETVAVDAHVHTANVTAPSLAGTQTASEQLEPDPLAPLGPAPAPEPDPAPAASANLPVPLPTPARIRRPWWAVISGALLRPWLRLKIEPGEPQALVDSRPVCYVLEDYGLSNALILQGRLWPVQCTDPATRER